MDENSDNNNIDINALKNMEDAIESISNLTINTPLTPLTHSTPTTPTTTTINSSTPKKELKNLVLYNLIDLNNSKCYLKYKGTTKDIELVLVNGEPTFRLMSPDQSKFLYEKSATTLLKSYFGLTTIKGNSYVYINDKKIDDYSFESFTTKTTTTKITPSNNNNNNDLIESTPGIDRSPYREIKIEKQQQQQPIMIKEEEEEEEEELQFFKRDENILSTNIKYNDVDGVILESAKIKPSGIGRFFHFGCERYLSFSTRQTYNPNDPIKSIQSPISIIQQKLIDDGFVWENQVLEHLENNLNNTTITGSSTPYRIFKPNKGSADISQQETIRILKEEKGTFYMIQSTLEPPPTFRRNLPDAIKFSISKPDYLLITTTTTNDDYSNGNENLKSVREIEIQDAKSTTVIAFHQKIQLAFYYLLLNDIIANYGIKDLKVSDRAGIYLKGNYQIEYFSLSDSVRILSSFLFGNLIKKQSYLLDILSVPKENSPWILSERCDGCEFINYCTNQFSTEKNLNSSVNIKSSSLLNLIKQDKEFQQQQHQQINEKQSSDLEYLFNTIKKDSIKNVTQKVDYIKSLPMIEASLKDKVVPTGSFDIRLSSYEDIQIYLEIAHDPRDQSIYQWGILQVSEVNGSQQKEETGISNHKFESGNNFMDLLIKLSIIFSQYNKSKLSLQCYIFDSFQKSLFFKHCFKKLKEITQQQHDDSNIEDGEISEAATNKLHKDTILLVLRTLLHSNEWINLNIDHYPQCNVPMNWKLSERQDEYSFLIIQDLIKTSFAINVKPFYTFENIVEKLLNSNNKEDNILNQDKLFNLILENKNIENLIENKLNYQVEMISKLKSQVFSNQTKIKLANQFLIRDVSKYNQNKHLAKLFYCYQNECISSYRKLKSIRSNPIEINLLDGTFTLLTFDSINVIQPTGRMKEKKFRIKFITNVYKQNLSKFEYQMEKSFSSFCIVNVNNISNSLWNLNEILDTKFENPKIEIISNFSSCFKINNQNNNSTDNFITLSLEIEVPSNKIFNDINENNKEFILFEKYDIGFFSMHKSLLKSYDQIENEGSLFLDILKNPNDWCKEVIDIDFGKLAGKVVDSLRDASMSKLKMTQSQENIFNSILKKKLTLVRGPPGTGKTHFLALLVLIYMECFKRIGKPFRIAISSFTHNAIDNLLLRIAALKKEYSVSIGQDINFPIYKKQSKLSDDLIQNHIISFDKKVLDSRDHLCLGATSWSLSTMDYNEFDLLIIDEASQLSSYIGAMPFQRLNKLTGKVIVCGDNKQLGPVLNDYYPNRKQLNVYDNNSSSGADNPKLQKSVFSCIKSHLIANGITTPYLSLYENFRMNKQLCEFSQTLYGNKYQCYYQNQEKITPLLFDQTDLNNQLIESIFNNDQSCHTILLDDTQFGDKNLESQIVKQIYRFLRKEYLKRPIKNSVVQNNDDGNVDVVNNSSRDNDALERLFWEKDLILGVITPLHIQRNTIIPMINRTQLKDFKLNEPVKPIVNTVEVTQGKEFENVILCYNGFNDFNRISEFSFDLNRLNVGFTRSKKRFILIVSTKLFFPDESIFNNKRMSSAYNHLIKFIEFSKIHKFYPQPIATAKNNFVAFDDNNNNLINQFNNVDIKTEKN